MDVALREGDLHVMLPEDDVYALAQIGHQGREASDPPGPDVEPEVEAGVAEAGHLHPGAGGLEHAGVRPGHLEQQPPHEVHVRAIGDADGDLRSHPLVAAQGPVDHPTADELGVGHDDRHRVPGLQDGGPRGDGLHLAHHVIHLHKVALPDGALQQQDEAADEVAGDVLEPKADPDADDTEDDGEGAEADAHGGEAQGDPQGHDQVARDGADGVPQAPIDGEVLQQVVGDEDLEQPADVDGGHGPHAELHQRPDRDLVLPHHKDGVGGPAEQAGHVDRQEPHILRREHPRGEPQAADPDEVGQQAQGVPQPRPLVLHPVAEGPLLLTGDHRGVELGHLLREQRGVGVWAVAAVARQGVLLGGGGGAVLEVVGAGDPVSDPHHPPGEVDGEGQQQQGHEGAPRVPPEAPSLPREPVEVVAGDLAEALLGALDPLHAHTDVGEALVGLDELLLVGLQLRRLRPLLGVGVLGPAPAVAARLPLFLPLLHGGGIEHEAEAAGERLWDLPPSDHLLDHLHHLQAEGVSDQLLSLEVQLLVHLAALQLDDAVLREGAAALDAADLGPEPRQLLLQRGDVLLSELHRAVVDLLGVLQRGLAEVHVVEGPGQVLLLSGEGPLREEQLQPGPAGPELAQGLQVGGELVHLLLHLAADLQGLVSEHQGPGVALDEGADGLDLGALQIGHAGQAGQGGDAEHVLIVLGVPGPPPHLGPRQGDLDPGEVHVEGEQLHLFEGEGLVLSLGDLAFFLELTQQAVGLADALGDEGGLLSEHPPQVGVHALQALDAAEQDVQLLDLGGVDGRGEVAPIPRGLDDREHHLPGPSVGHLGVGHASVQATIGAAV